MLMNDDVWYVILSFCDYSERGCASILSKNMKHIASLLDWNPICQKYIGVDGNIVMIKEWKRNLWTFYTKYATFHTDTVSPIQLKGRPIKCWSPWAPVEFCQCDDTSLKINFKSHYNSSHAQFNKWLEPLVDTEFMLWTRGPVDIVAKREWPQGARWDLPTTISNEYTGHVQKKSRAYLPLEGMVQALVTFKPFFISVLEPTRVLIMHLHELRIIDSS